MACSVSYKTRYALLALMALTLGSVVGCDRNQTAAAISEEQLAQVTTPPKSGSQEPAKAEPAQNGAEATAPANPPRANPAAKAEAPKPEHPFPHRTPAPALDGGVDWLNAAGPIDLKDLRGKFVLLDFWTYCCINCIHVLPELKKLEKAYPNNLVVIGVHSAKFETEEDTESIRQAVQRYEIEHPVVNDAQHKIWNRYGSRSWPSLRMIDPEGNLVAVHSGEIEFEVLDDFFKRVLPYYREKGLLNEKPVQFALESANAAKTPLRYPGKILADEAGKRLFITDSNHNRIVVTSLEGKLQSIIGSGTAGRADGGFRTAQFDHPQGLALRGNTLYVADTENHLLRKVDLENQQVTTIAGLGMQGRSAWPGLDMEAIQPKLPERFVAPPAKTAINSPWALWIHGDDLYIAMAGPHQIWKMPLDESEIGPYAGNGREDIVDGSLLPKQPYQLGFSSFAQPSGLSSDGKSLFVADSEGSSIRAVPFDPAGQVTTIVGTANLDQGRLFEFGDVDGKNAAAKLQHALEVVYAGGKLYVADTYNHKIKVIDLAAKTTTTLAGTGKAGKTDSAAGQPAMFFEPTGLAHAAGKLYVADTNNHVIRAIDLADNSVTTLEIAGLTAPAAEKTANPMPTKPDFADAQQVKLDSTELKAVEGNVHLSVKLVLPKGYKINELAPMRYYVEAVGQSGPVDRAAIGKLIKLEKPTAQFDVPLAVTAATGEDSVQLSFRYYYCQEGAEGLCKIGSVTFTVPMKLTAEAQTATAELPLTVE